MSDDPVQKIAAAETALAAGRIDEAERLCALALRQEPSSPEGRILFGMIQVMKGRHGDAETLLREVATESDPPPSAPLWLSRALRGQGRSSEALDFAIQAADRLPTDPGARFQLGLCQLESKQFAEAVRSFQRGIELDPSASQLYLGLGKALQGAQRGQQAIAAFRRASELAPNSLSALSSLCESLIEDGEADEAVECTRRLLQRQGNGAEAHLRAAQALVIKGDLATAETHARQARLLAPRSGQAAYLLGSIFRQRGQETAAEVEFRRSIELQPAQGAAYSALAYGSKSHDAAFVGRMRDLAEDGRLPPTPRSELQYALGKCAEDTGDYEGAMRHFDAANALASDHKLGGRRFDRALYALRIDEAIATFDGSFLRRYQLGGLSSPLPLFVVGMIRSGTTLMEQILSCHPNVGAAGEQRFWLSHRNFALDQAGPRLDMDKLRHFGDQYLEILKRISPGKKRVIDKMPDNYLELPTIHLAFPNAKIIHLIRNPLDTCISIYTTPNRLGIEWIHRKEDIVFVYRQYQRIVERWRRVLPEGTMLDVHYEDLVSDQERVTREIVAFCGLEWSDAFLRPEQNRRTVSTPSVSQVREPVYTTSVGRWRRYEPWLGTFAELLQDDEAS